MRGNWFQRYSILPGFWPSFGLSMLYLSLVVLVPLSAIFLKTASMTWPRFWSAVTSPAVVASYRLTFGASLGAALVNAFFGFLVAWVLARYSFPGKKLVDALVDEPAMKDYHLLPSIRGDLLERLGRGEEARMEFERAASLTRNERERELLLRRVARVH